MNAECRAILRRLVRTGNESHLAPELRLGDGIQHLLQGAFIWQSVPMAEVLHEVRHCRPISRAKYRSVLANSEGEVDVVP